MKRRSSATSRTPGSWPKRRNMHYEILGDPMFRERDVPRMLELATAREAGDTSVPAELQWYPARSRTGKRSRDGSIADTQEQEVADDAPSAFPSAFFPSCNPFCNPAILQSCNFLMVRYHASWVLPIAEPPIRDGWIVTDHGRIVAYGAYGAVTRRAPAHAESREVDLGNVALLPGLVNAHTHLELSYLRDEVPPASEFVTWIRKVMAARRQQPHASAPVILDAIERAIAESTAFGTAVVGDISNTLVSFQALTRSPLAAVLFFEILGFNISGRDRRWWLMPAARSRRSAPPNASATQSRRTRALQRRAAGVPRHPPGQRSRSVRPVQRPSVGIGRGGRIPPHRRRPMAPAARGSRGLEYRVARARRQPGAVSR